MEWLADNWVWILVGIGFVWFLTRGHAGMGCGGGHSHGSQEEIPEKNTQKEPTSPKRACH